MVKTAASSKPASKPKARKAPEGERQAPSKKRKPAYVEEADEEASDKELAVVAAKKPRTKASAKPKAVAKPKPKAKAKEPVSKPVAKDKLAKKASKSGGHVATVAAREEWGDSDDGEEEEEKYALADRVMKRKTTTFKAAAETRVIKSAASSSGAATGKTAALRKKHEEMQAFRETEAERLLQQTRTLAKEETKTYERMVARLKKELVAQSARADAAEAKRKRQLDALQEEMDQRVESFKRERAEAQEDLERLRRQVRELERSGRGDSAHSSHRHDRHAPSVSDEATAELARAKKILFAYRLITSTDVRLLEPFGEDADGDGESDTFTDVACATIDSATGKRFQFDLALPHNETDEIEYVPSEEPSPDFKVPSYLQEELSFKRTEMAKFMRTVLDVVIRKQRDEPEEPSRNSHRR